MVQRTYGVKLTTFHCRAADRVHGLPRPNVRISWTGCSTASSAMRNVPGSLAVATITCAVFATATGIIGAVVTLMGLLALR